MNEKRSVTRIQQPCNGRKLRNKLRQLAGTIQSWPGIEASYSAKQTACPDLYRFVCHVVNSPVAYSYIYDTTVVLYRARLIEIMARK